MEIIAELEPTQRGVYCGSIGYLSATGAMDTSIVIRTYLALRGQVYFQAGGGIVADSDPELEYRETLDKARALIEALAGYMILLIDNYDSFVYNLARYVRELGETPLVRRHDAIDGRRDRCAGALHIIISPGPCSPAEAGISTEVVRRLGATHPDPRRLPGPPVHRGRLWRRDRAGRSADARQDLDDPPLRHRPLRGLPTPFRATRYHSLVIAPASVPPALEVTGHVGGRRDHGGAARASTRCTACSSIPSRC